MAQSDVHGGMESSDALFVIITQQVWTIWTFQRQIFQILPRAWQDHTEETEPLLVSRLPCGTFW